MQREIHPTILSSLEGIVDQMVWFRENWYEEVLRQLHQGLAKCNAVAFENRGAAHFIFQPDWWEEKDLFFSVSSTRTYHFPLWVFCALQSPSWGFCALQSPSWGFCALYSSLWGFCALQSPSIPILFFIPLRSIHEQSLSLSLSLSLSFTCPLSYLAFASLVV
ncbi:TRRAP [Acanthosepion pharaonis]|uniref:TRRAP n=1 Tax=Acanthosepion pharaonis TaxID=158019 RepID=A0A812DZP1_ACAPH|nr:TRRAP [Sepia pharaonis]